MKNQQDIITRVETSLGIDPTITARAIKRFKRQIEHLDGAPIDLDHLTPNQANMLYDAVVGWLKANKRTPEDALKKVADAAAKVNDKKTELQFLTESRDQEIINALDNGATVVATAKAADLTRSVIYDIKQKHDGIKK